MHVANRIQAIRDYTEPDQWHIKYSDRPSDFAISEVWLNRPEFLHDRNLSLETCLPPKVHEVPTDDIVSDIMNVVACLVFVSGTKTSRFGLSEHLLAVLDWLEM